MSSRFHHPAVRLSFVVASVAMWGLLASACGSSGASSTTTTSTGSSAVQSTVPPSGPNAQNAAAVAAVAAATRVQTLPQNVKPPLQDVANDTFPLSPAASACNHPSSATGVICTYGDAAASDTIVLAGDSHAQMWEPAINAMALHMHWKLLLIAKPSCPFTGLKYLHTESDWNLTAQCTQWDKNALTKIASVHPRVLIIVNDHYNSPSDWQSAMHAVITEVSGSVGKVVMIGQIPDLANGTAACLARHESGIQACSSSASGAVLSNFIAVEKQVAAETGATYVDVTPWLCTSSTCPVVIDNIVVYHDFAHITLTFGLHLEPALAETLQNKNVFSSNEG